MKTAQSVQKPVHRARRKSATVCVVWSATAGRWSVEIAAGTRDAVAMMSVAEEKAWSVWLA